jgi:hypothetical protein
MTYRVVSLYQHVQEEEADVWTINHGTGSYPVVDVYVMIEGDLHKVIPSEVTYISPMVCTISFTEPYIGFAQVC